ncbi:MAG: hypothetical protein ACYS6W_17435 [Planctomycetota bacterium]
MAIKTLTEPTADEQQCLVYNRKMRVSNSAELPLGKKLACVVLQLNGVVVPDDYPALATAIKAIPGIQDVFLLVDGQTPANIPDDTVLTLVAEVQLRIDNTEAP